MNKTNTKICAVIIARNGSSRLPNKALANICGKTILELISERISHSNQIQKTIIATSTNKEDDKIEFEANKLGIDCFRGDSEDVRRLDVSMDRPPSVRVGHGVEHSPQDALDL